MVFDARVSKSTDIKSPWEIATNNLAEHHFKSGRDPQERKQLAARFLSDTLHFMVNHQGKDEKTSKALLGREFADPNNIPKAMRTYQMGGGL